MIWRCDCGHVNNLQRGLCLACGRPGRAPMGRAEVGQIPPAVGRSPVWPIPGYRKWSRASFGGDRPWNDPTPTRYHAGVDIHAPRGTTVVATEDGRILAKHRWRTGKTPERTTDALLLQVDGGPVLVYGALIPGSWEVYGVSVGSRVLRGQPIGQVGTYPKGDQMLHIEARKPGTRAATPWYRNQPTPASLLNITPYLEQASQAADEVLPVEPADPLVDLPLPASRERWVQLVLRATVAPGLQVDGKIGPATRAAIRAYQKARGLDVDGIVGPQTLAAMRAETDAPPPFWGEEDVVGLFDRVKSALADAWREVFA